MPTSTPTTFSDLMALMTPLAIKNVQSVPYCDSAQRGPCVSSRRIQDNSRLFLLQKKMGQYISQQVFNLKMSVYIPLPKMFCWFGPLMKCNPTHVRYLSQSSQENGIGITNADSEPIGIFGLVSSGSHHSNPSLAIKYRSKPDTLFSAKSNHKSMCKPTDIIPHAN